MNKEGTEAPEEEHTRKQRYAKFKGRKFNFQERHHRKTLNWPGVASLENRPHKRIYLHNVTEKWTRISARVYSVPRALREIHAYHPERMKLVESFAKAHARERGPHASANCTKGRRDYVRSAER